MLKDHAVPTAHPTIKVPPQPSPGILQRLVEHSAAPSLKYEYDQTGALVRVSGVDGADRQQLDVTGQFPAETATISKDGKVYLTASTTSQHVNFRGVGAGDLFILRLQSSAVELCYEVIATSNLSAMFKPGITIPFAVTKLVPPLGGSGTWVYQAAAHGRYSLPTQSFVGVVEINVSALDGSAAGPFMPHPIAAGTDFSPENTLSNELSLARFFMPAMIPLASSETETVRSVERAILHILSWAIGGVAGVGAGVLTRNLYIGGAVGGAIGASLQELVDAELPPSVEGGGGGTSPAASAGSGGESGGPPSDDTKKKKEPEKTK